MTPPDRRPRWLALAPLAAGLLGAAIYAGALGNGFTFDDPLIVVENPLVTGQGGPWEIFRSHYWASEGGAGNLYRPLTTLTYWLDHRWSGRSPFGYHLVNLLLHGAVTFLVYLTLRRLAREGPEETGETVAGIGALLFAAHPIHTEAVASVVGRAELLAALLVLGAWLLRDRPWTAALLYGLGLLSKENAVVLPGLLLVEDLAIRRVRPALRSYLPLGAALGAFLILRGAVLSSLTGPVEGPFDGVPAPHRILTAVGVLGRCLALMLWPARLSADYSYDQIPIVTSLIDPVFLAGALACAACAGLAWIARRRLPAVSAGILIHFVALAPVSNVPFGIGVMMAERLLYLPSAGLCLAAASALVAASSAFCRAAGRPRRASAFAAFLACLLAIPLAARAAWRTTDWFDQLTLFEATVKSSPRSALAWLNLATTYRALGRLPEAENAFRKTMEIAPDRPGPHFNLAALMEGEGRLDEAIALYEGARRIAPGDFRVLNSLGRALTTAGRGAEAIPILEQAAALQPGAAAPRVSLAAAHLQAGHAPLALKLIAEVLADHPDDAAARRLMEKMDGD